MKGMISRYCEIFLEKTFKKFCLGIKNALHLHSLSGSKAAMLYWGEREEWKQSSLKDIKKRIEERD
jgi:hypothetical protein